MTRGYSLYDEAAQQGRLWTPMALMQYLFLWYDVSDLSTITASSNLVSQMTDKSGRGKTASASGSARPTLIQSSPEFNNLPVLSLDGSATSMSVSSVSDTNRNYFLFGVFRNDLANNVANYVIDGTSICALGETTSPYGLSFYRVTSWRRSGKAATQNTPGVCFWNMANSNGGCRFNGVAGTTLSGGSAPFNGTTCIFSNSAGTGNFVQGLFGEMVLCRGNLPLLGHPVILLCEGYLAWKWGLQNSLPASHPFAHRPPTMSDDI